MTRPSRLTVLAGPTAVGKGTVSADIRQRYPQVWLSVSATTRPPRPGEQEGRDYCFVDDTQFDRMIDRGELLEWAHVHGLHRYGTPAGPVRQRLAAGHPVLLEIDLAGARQVKARMPEAMLVFLAPPSLPELFSRLRGRGTETEEEQQRRLQTAQIELAAEPEFDHTVVNHTVRQASDDLVSLMGLCPHDGDQAAAAPYRQI